MEETLSSTSWMKFANETYIKEAGWYFKSLAVQEIGTSWILNGPFQHSIFYHKVTSRHKYTWRIIVNVDRAVNIDGWNTPF